MTVEALNCPNCGAGVASDSTQCEFLAEIKNERSRLREDQRKQGVQDKGFGLGNLLDDHHESGTRGFVRSLFS